jgi:glucose-6-phosphate 1-dehydrogenase
MTSLALVVDELDESQIPEDHVIVLFGATGDLARRKLLPGLFRLARAGLLPLRYRIVAVSRGELSDDEFRTFAREAVAEFGHVPGDGSWDTFARNLSYTSAESHNLAAAVARAEAGLGRKVRRLFYLSVPPVAFGEILESLAEAGLNENARVVCEKPFGTDLTSARALNSTMHRVFDEADVFRIDHFLGKESVQNILALRFANGAFEPMWNRDHVKHVQIDVPETLSIGTRASFYEDTGAYKDMVVTHLLQVLGFVAMEPPTSFSANALLNETAKVFESLVPIRSKDVVRGQYVGYRDEPGVAPDSQTETFIAAKVEVDNWRWAGVPFYLRTGKCLAQGRRVLTITFREPPLRMFGAEHESFGPNELVFDFGEGGGISATFLAKVPGPTMKLGRAQFRFDYGASFGEDHELEAYERLIHDALMGDRTLFTRGDGIERLWAVSAPLLADPGPVYPYEQGSWGPAAARELVGPGGWHLPEKAA